jgi:uncharacterized membrane protein
MSLLFILFSCFFAFNQAIRYYNHFSLMINVNITYSDIESIYARTPAISLILSRDQNKIASLLDKGSLAHSLGLRGFYILFPVIAWLFGAWYFLGGTVVLVLIMVCLDYQLVWILQGMNWTLSGPNSR